MTFEEHVKLIKSNKKRPIKLTRKNILKYIVECGKVLDEQAVPKKNRQLGYWNGKEVVVIKI